MNEARRKAKRERGTGERKARISGRKGPSADKPNSFLAPRTSRIASTSTHARAPTGHFAPSRVRLTCTYIGRKRKRPDRSSVVSRATRRACLGISRLTRVVLLQVMDATRDATERGRRSFPSTNQKPRGLTSRDGAEIRDLFWRGGRGVSGVYEVYARQLSRKGDRGNGGMWVWGGREVDRARALRAAVKVKAAETGDPIFATGQCRSESADAETRAKGAGDDRRKCYKRNGNRDCGKPGKPRGEETSRASRRLVLELLDLLPRVRLVAAVNEHTILVSASYLSRLKRPQVRTHK